MAGGPYRSDLQDVPVIPCFVLNIHGTDISLYGSHIYIHSMKVEASVMGLSGISFSQVRWNNQLIEQIGVSGEFTWILHGLMAGNSDADCEVEVLEGAMLYQRDG
jgi:hypothetical protein